MMTVRISSGMMGAISRAIGDGLFNTTMIVLVRGSGDGLRSTYGPHSFVTWSALSSCGIRKSSPSASTAWPKAEVDEKIRAAKRPTACFSILTSLVLKRENYATRPDLGKLSRAKVNGMGRFEGPQRSKDIKPKDSQGILAKLADSNLAKTIRAGTAAAMLYGAMPATEAEAAPKQRPLAAQTQKAKPGKAQESAKKASPADQLRERRQRVEREAAQMIAEKHALGQLAAENVPQEILEKISAAKNGRDLARISWSKDFDALGTNAQFAMLKYMNVSRFANQYETMDNIFSRLSSLPLTEETRDFALQVAPHVHPRDKDDTSYSFPVSSFMTGVLRKSMKGDEYRELRATTKAWAEKMIMTLAKNMPREELMDRVITSQYKYYPFHRVFRSDPHSIDVEGLMRKAYPLQTLNEISKVYEQKAEKNPHASEQSSQWFFNSRYWQYLLPEEQLAFVRANLPKPNDTSRDKMLLNLLDKRDALTQYSAKNYDDVLAEIGK